LGDSEVRAACELAHLALEHLSKREICTRKLVLRQLPQTIALVLPVIPATKKAIASSRLIVLDASIMSRCDLVAPQRLGHPVQRGKLKPGITRDARSRRLAMQITLYNRLDHIAVKILFEIENIERKPERICHTPCVVDIVKRTAPRRQRVAILIGVYQTPLIPQLHRKADKLVPLLL